ncbi:hypothetical protein ABEB36_014739 [Hypothenemus hampei]|uniref:Uncharacterized protein n=1 Tax=Hypothenemus hampei TaxID=57062 RepID=A0ABD1E2Z6_HYPHA
MLQYQAKRRDLTDDAVPTEHLYVKTSEVSNALTATEINYKERLHKRQKTKDLLDYKQTLISSLSCQSNENASTPTFTDTKFINSQMQIENNDVQVLAEQAEQICRLEDLVKQKCTTANSK